MSMIMEAIVAVRYDFYDFSNIASFPHPMLSITEWGDYLPRFRGNKYEHPHEALIKFS